MITLIGGHVQNQGGVAVPNGSISFQLNMDATVVATPSGLVPSEQITTFQFDDTGNLQADATLWSNAELNPQNDSGLGTYYLVTIYDGNGARINKSPMWWQFPNPAGATVDISFMTAINTIGGNVIFYPNLAGSAFNGVNPQVSNYKAVPADSGKLIVFASASPVTLSLPDDVPAKTWWILVQNIGPGVLTINRNGHLLDTASVNLSVAATQGTVIGSSGTAFYTERGLLSGSSSVSGYLGWHNVMDYGAVGDAVTDDSDAIQAAINAATLNPTGGGRVYFPKPPVNYYLAKPLYVDCSNATQLYMYGDQGPRQGGVDQFARAPRIRIEGNGISLFQMDNFFGGGGNYQVGDTGIILGNNTGSGATYQVTQVSGQGQVQAFTITAPGTGYLESTYNGFGYVLTNLAKTTVTSGQGNGLFTVGVQTIDGGGGITAATTGFGNPRGDSYITMENLDWAGVNGNALWFGAQPFILMKNCGAASNFDPARDHSAALILEGTTLWFKTVDSSFADRDHNTGEYRPTMTCTGVTTSSGGNAVYSITPEDSGFGVIFPNGGEGNRNYIGMKFLIAGFVAHGSNNGTFTCVAATGTSLTLNNPSAIAEVHAATCRSTTSADPSSWAPPTILIVANDAADGCVLFNFDFCTFSFGGVKLEVVAPGASGDTFGNFIFNQCALEGAFGGPLLQVENVSASGGSGSSNVSRVIMWDCQLADLAHEAPLISVKGYPNHTMGVGTVTTVHCTQHGGIVQGLYSGFSNAAGIYVDDPTTSTRCLDIDSTLLSGSSQVSHRHSGWDCNGPLVGPSAAFAYDVADGGALRTFISDPALADSATSMRDMDGSDYFGPGGVYGTPFDMKVGRASLAKWAVQVPVPYPDNFAAMATAGGTLPDGDYYLRIASGDRNNTPFTTSAASPEIGPITCGGGNNTISCTWTAVPTNTLNTGKYTIYVGTTPGGENKASNTGGSNPSSATISSMPSPNQTPSEVGDLLTTAFTFDGTGGRDGSDPSTPESVNEGGVVFTADDTHTPGDTGTVVAWLKIKSSNQTYYLPMYQ